MDSKTISEYDKNAKLFAERHSKIEPQRLYDLAKTFFKLNGASLDLGCGIGRDTNWLCENGFPAEGVDASVGMLEQAKKAYPEIKFNKAQLPEVNFDSSFENIFCSAVLMHIPRSALVSTVISLLKALKTNGRLVLSYRSGHCEIDDRLFETYHPGQVAQLFESLGGKVLLIEKDGIWENLVIEKQDINKRDGIRLIQDIITRDKKVATYKFALIRALCEISRYEAHIVTWYREGDMVLVPMQRIAARWVLYYWPLVKEGIKQTTSERMAFEEQLRAIPYKASDMIFLKNDLDEVSSNEIKSILTKVSNTIKVGPVKYAGGGENDIFGFVSSLDESVYPELRYSKNGMVTVPISLWRDINLFAHWIEDSLSIQWAELSSKINKDGKFGTHLDLITKSVQKDERDTYPVRKMLKGRRISCVWTGKEIVDYDVDHVIPWSLWRNNDLWNLLPADPKVNNAKRDRIPTPKLIAKNIHAFRKYWEIYEESFPELFQKQIQKALGVDGKSEREIIEAMEQTLIRINSTLGGSFWE
jgi:SAM-dependent methyltransferase